MEQLSLFDLIYEKYKITKPIRLIELFSGYGSQALALKYLGVQFTHWRICEWATKSIQAYNDLHIRDYTDYSEDLTVAALIERLAAYGVSMNYNEPMTVDQIKRKGEVWLRQTYNNIIATHNLVDISKAKAKDLNIIDTDNFTYLLTYSFPCQDLSQAGFKAGFSKGSGTRSGLLWQVERLLDECEELPQVLVMENVKTLITSTKNLSVFNQWQKKLEQLGYTNYVSVLNACHFGIPQNRERCFMVSILKNSGFTFPNKLRIKPVLKNILINNIDSKYFIKKILNAEIKEKYIQYDNSNKGYASQAARLYYINGLCPTLPCNNNGDKSQIILLTKDEAREWLTGGKDITAISRRLTPNECWRLMGVKNADYSNVAANQSQSSLYHLAGDSIVTTVLMAIFGELLGLDYETKIAELVENLKECI